MKRFVKLFWIVACLIALPSVVRADEATDKIKTIVKNYTDGKIMITSIEKTPIVGILEATAGLDVFYIDSSGRYGFVDGRLIDMKEQKDLTATKLEKVSRINFKDLPLDLAIKTVHGNGQRVVAVFEDPA